jgi:hypothetical protein
MVWGVLDIGDDNQVLVSDSGRLMEIGSDGTRVVDEPGRAARYLPGERSIVIEHEGKISLLGKENEPITGELLEVLPGRVVYRDGDGNVVIRSLFSGEEQAVYDRGGDILEATVSHDSRFVALRLAEMSLLVATMPETEDDHLRPLGDETTGKLRGLGWLGESSTVVATGEDSVIRWDADSGEWTALLPAPSPRTVAVPSPDGRMIALTDETLRLHEAKTGDLLREVRLTARGTPVWSPNSHFLAVDADGPILLDVRTGATRPLLP